MDELSVLKFIKCPSAPLVDLALEMANLSWREAVAIELCARKGYTQEYASEEAKCSVDSMQRWYRSAINKLCKAWGGVWWIKKVIE